MGAQYEKPGVDLEQLARTLKVSSKGAIASGGQLVNFRRGWAVFIMGDRLVRAHFYRRSDQDLSRARSLCGQDVPVKLLYGRGNYPVCQLCRRRAADVQTNPDPEYLESACRDEPSIPEESAPWDDPDLNKIERAYLCIESRGPITTAELRRLLPGESGQSVYNLKAAGRIESCGGGSRNKLWRAIEADL